MKRFSTVFLVLFLAASIVGCNTGETPVVSPVVTAADGSIIDDFYFIGESGELDLELEYMRVYLDTKNNIIGGWGATWEAGRARSKYLYVDYHMPQNRLQELYDDIIKYDIKSYSGRGILGDDLPHPAHLSFARATFQIDGEVYSITYMNTIFAQWDKPWAMEEFDNLCMFFIKVTNYYLVDTDAYRAIEDTRIYPG